MKQEGRRAVSRREFIQTAGLVAGASLFAGSMRDTLGADNPNAFAYDVDRFSKTDPALVRFQESLRFKSPGPEPRRVAAGPEGNLLLACKTGVYMVNPQGQTQLEIPLPSPARAVCATPDGNLCVALRDHLELYDLKGRRVAVWEKPGPKTWFTGLTAGAPGIFAADAGNRVVLHYDNTGKLVKRIGTKDAEKKVPGLIVPSPYLDVALGRDGLLRVNNPGRHCVEVYTTDGDLELSWGKPSAAIRGFCGCCNPISVGMLADGACVTSEKGLPRVKVYSATGEFVSVVAGPESFPLNGKPGATRDLSDGSLGGLDAAADASGKVYILDLVAADVRVMNPKAA